MDRSVQVNSKIGLCTFYLDYSGVDLKVWELEHVSKTVKIVASATVEEAILDGYLGLFSLPDTPRLIIFIKTYSFIQYSWLNVHEVSVQSLVFVTLKLNNFKPTSHLAITLAPSLTRFAILQSDDVLLIGEEIKTSLLAVNTNPMSWVTDLGVFKNYVQVENDLLLDMKDTPFSEDILVVTTKDRVTGLVSLSVCEMDWAKRKLKVLWRLPAYAEHVYVVCMGSTTKDGKVLMCVHNTLCVYDMEGQQVCMGTVSSIITSVSLLHTAITSSECILSTATGCVYVCQLDNAKCDIHIEDISASLIQLTDYMSHTHSMSSHGICTQLDVLHFDAQQGLRSLVLVGSNTLTSTLYMSPHVLHEYANIHTLGFYIHQTNYTHTDILAHTHSHSPTHTHRQIGLCMSGYPAVGFVYESVPMTDVTYTSTLSVDLESVYDAHALAPVYVHNDVYVALTSRVTQQTSILHINSRDAQATYKNPLASMVCTVEYTHNIYTLANYIIQVTSSMLFVYNTASHTQWKVAWNELVSSASTSHKIHNVVILFAISCHNSLYLYCTKTLVKIWFNVSKLDRGQRQGIQEVIVEDMTCRCAYVTSSTYRYPDSNMTNQFDYVIAQSYWEDSKIKLDYHHHNPTNTQFHDTVSLEVPLPSTPQHHEIVKDMKVVLLQDLIYLAYQYKHQLYMCEVKYDASSRQLSCTILWSFSLSPSEHIMHMSISTDAQGANATGILILLNNDNVLEICTNTNNIPCLTSYYLPYTRVQSVHKVGKEILCNFQEEMGHGIGRCTEAENNSVGYHVTKTRAIEGQRVLIGRTQQNIIVYRERDAECNLSIHSASSLDVLVECILPSPIHALPCKMDYHAPYSNMFFTISISQGGPCIDVHAFQYDTYRGTVALGGKASCAVYTHPNLTDSLYHYTSVMIGSKKYLALLTNTSNLCLLGWNDSKQFTVLSHMEVSVCSPSLKMVKLPWDSTVSLMLVHSIICYNDFVVVNLATGKIILFQCTVLASDKFTWKILLELAMERPVLSMHIFPSSLIASDRHLYDTMTFFAYSSQSEDLYLYHVSVPTAYADEDTLAASVINPTYVLRRFVLESALRRMIMSSGIIDAKAVTAGDLSQPIHWARHEVKLKSVQRLEHIGSNEDSIRDVGELWWLLSLSNNEGVILKPLLDQA